MRFAARGDDRYPKHQQQAQGPLHFAIVDEVDNILIDEARTPLIISGPAEDDITKYQRADKVARQLEAKTSISRSRRRNIPRISRTKGVREAERLAGVESFYTAGNMQWPHLIDNSLKAHYLYIRDVNYVVQDGEVVIVDEFTGRLMPGRHWSDGLHQAVEAKEGVPIKEENQTLATITLQNFFKLYDKISGMTGTALTEAGEFWKIYKLDVIGVPTNRHDAADPLSGRDLSHRAREIRSRSPTKSSGSTAGRASSKKDGSMVVGTVRRKTIRRSKCSCPRASRPRSIPRDKVKKIQQPGRPMLVGTVSIEKSERLSRLLEKRGIKHEVLNAKHHKREAEIVAQAGRKGAVTIATNMAGRGTDIILGGNAGDDGLGHAAGQVRHAARRARRRVEQAGQRDRPTRRDEGRGAAGQRAGRPAHRRHRAPRSPPHRLAIARPLRSAGRSRQQPLLSLARRRPDADLCRRVGQERAHAARHAGRRGDREQDGLAANRRAQKKVEERNFEVRKSLLEYDEVMDEQRKRVYSYRQKILDGVNCRDLVGEMIGQQVDENLSQFLDPTYGSDSFAAAAGNLLHVQLEGRELSQRDVQRRRADGPRRSDSHGRVAGVRRDRRESAGR